jgi:hypothetical protein
MKATMIFMMLGGMVVLASSCAVRTYEKPNDPTYALQAVFPDKVDIENLAFPAPSAFRLPLIVDEPWFLVCRSGLLEDIARTGARLQIVWPGQNATNYYSIIHGNPPGPWVGSVTPQTFTSQDTVEIRLKQCRGPDETEASNKPSEGTR